MTVNAIANPSVFATLKLVVSVGDDGAATETSAPKPFYSSNSIDNPLVPTIKPRPSKLELMTPARALGSITDKVLDLLCKSFATSAKASPEMKRLMKSKESTDRKEGFTQFVIQQSNIFIYATNANLSTPLKRHVKNPGSAARRSKVKRIALTVVKTDKKDKKGGKKPANRK